MELIVTAVERSLIRIAIYAMIAISISDPAKLDMACAIRLAKERNRRELIKNFRRRCNQSYFLEGVSLRGDPSAPRGVARQ